MVLRREGLPEPLLRAQRLALLDPRPRPPPLIVGVLAEAGGVGVLIFPVRRGLPRRERREREAGGQRLVVPIN